MRMYVYVLRHELRKMLVKSLIVKELCLVSIISYLSVDGK